MTGLHEFSSRSASILPSSLATQRHQTYCQTAFIIFLEPLTNELFGEESLDSLSNLSAELIPMTKAIIQQMWLSICTKVGNVKKKMGTLEQKAQWAFEGKAIHYIC